MAQILSQEAIDGAFEWLQTNSETVAIAKVKVKRTEYQAKRIFARLFKRAEGSVETRKAWATDHEDYAQAMEAVFEAEEAWEQMADQRNKREIILELWRTKEASERQVRSIR